MTPLTIYLAGTVLGFLGGVLAASLILSIHDHRESKAKERRVSDRVDAAERSFGPYIESMTRIRQDVKRRTQDLSRR